MVRKFALILIFLCIAFQLLGQDSVKVEEVDVIVGIDKIVPLDFVPNKQVQLGNRRVLDYQLAGGLREITLKGVKPGDSSLTLRDNAGTIRAKFKVKVTATDQSRVVQEIRELVGEIEGIEVGVKGGKVYVGGHIVVPRDIGKIVITLEKYPDVIPYVELSPQTQVSIAKKMQNEIHKNGMRDVTVRVVNGLFLIEGIVPSKQHEEKALKIAVIYLPDMIDSLAKRTQSVRGLESREIIQNLLVIDQKVKPTPPEKLIKITAQFVELSKDYSKVFAFKWTPLLAGTGGSINIGKSGDGGVTTKAVNGLAATISNLFPRLASAKSAGYARVLQSGMVLVKNGKQGTISKESTVPFAVGTGEFTKADKATSGFNLGITPQIGAQESIDLNLNLSVSSSTGNPPTTLKNNIKTNMIVKNKESAVVGGIAINKTSTQFDKNPPFNTSNEYDENEAVPLFSFLRSKQHIVDRSQFVVFITPEIVQSASEGTEDVKRKFRKRRR